MTQLPETPSLSALLRQRTSVAHQNAERAPAIRRFFRGEFKPSTYGALLHRLQPAYRALERGLRRHAEHPVVAAFVRPELWRSSALERDLAYYEVVGECTDPAALDYAARIGQCTHRHPHLLLAHAYTRYLGDLSGGQIVRAQLPKQLGIPEGEGSAFLEFPNIDDVEAYKQGFRRALDTAQLSPAEQLEVVAEANNAFDLNRAVADSVERDYFDTQEA